VSGLETKELKLADLVVSLGEFLNNDKPITRERAMCFLADVIAAIPTGVLPLQHRKLLFDFITSRLTDQDVGIGSAARALLGLEERGRWDAEQVAEVIKALMEGTPQLLHRGSMNQRYPVFLLIDRLMANYRKGKSNKLALVQN
jgi:DNA repair/transcription protein MET18/MMS19